MEGRDAAACGRRRRPGLSAAVEKREHTRKREAFFGHRKVEGRSCAAGGGCSSTAFSAAVEKREHSRKREAFFGHRKVEGVVVSNGTPSRQPWQTL